MLSKTAEKVLENYGGHELWKKSRFLEAEVSVSGLLFKMKKRPNLEHAFIKMEIHKPFSKITPIGKNFEISGCLDSENVWLEQSGKEIDSKENIRAELSKFSNFLKWNDLQMAYFANYAFWNYLTFPNLLINDKIKWVEPEIGILKATFPDSIPTHSKNQTYYFDKDTFLLKQHNYTAEVVSNLATAANVIKEHKNENGLLYPSRRIITPQSKKNGYLKFPVLVDITVHHLKIY
jgi:hypothetical protein